MVEYSVVGLDDLETQSQCDELDDTAYLFQQAVGTVTEPVERDRIVTCRKKADVRCTHSYDGELDDLFYDELVDAGVEDESASDIVDNYRQEEFDELEV